MADLASLVQAFTGQASQPSSPDLPWQNQLMQQVDPETARRRNIANALQKASAALATTPGNFLTGLSAAANTGAGEYLQGRDANDMKRIEAMRAIEQANTAQKDRDLGRLKDAFTVQNQYDNTVYGREQDAKRTDQWEREFGYRRTQDEKNHELRVQQVQSLDAYRQAKAGIDIATGKTSGASGTLTAGQRIAALNAINKFTFDFEKRRIAAINDDWSIPAEEKPARLAAIAQEKEAFKQSLMQEYQLDGAPQVQNPAASTTPGAGGKTDKGGAVAKPAPDMALQQARDAIARGADPEAVRQRLIQNGYDASGL